MMQSEYVFGVKKIQSNEFFLSEVVASIFKMPKNKYPLISKTIT